MLSLNKCTDRIFCFSAFFLKFFINTSLTVSFQKIDPVLGAVTIGAELTRLGAKAIGTVDLGVELGAELWKWTNFNFYHDLDID